MALMRQRFFDSRTLVNAQEFSPYLPQPLTSQYLPSPFSQFPQSPIPQFPQPPISQSRNNTRPSSRDDHACKISGVPPSRKVKCNLQKPSLEDMTALSLEILHHSEKLQSVLNSEILEVVSFVWETLVWYYLLTMVYHIGCVYRPSRKYADLPQLAINRRTDVIFQTRGHSRYFGYRKRRPWTCRIYGIDFFSLSYHYSLLCKCASFLEPSSSSLDI